MPKAASAPPPTPVRCSFLLGPIALLILAAATIASYFNSLDGPFIFDDISAIYENPTIRDLSRIGDILRPPSDSGVTVNGRPLVNLTLALNYAAGGNAVRGYHVVNVGIHTLAALTLFGLARRLTARRLDRSIEDFGVVMSGLAFGAVWALHPLQTQSVTYVIQRAEALVGLFYLLTLYAFARSQEAGAARIWKLLTVTSCWLGVGSKEVIVSVPIVALLCDRTFFSRTFSEAWRRNRLLHAALFLSWIPLAWQIHGAGGRGGTVGFGIGGVTWWMYLLTQAEGLTRYVVSSLWPSRLVFDYGTGVAQGIGEVWLQFGLVVTLFGGTVIALIRHPLVGFFAAAFFLILAPSSSFVPIVTESLAEHRMYLPLAAVAGLLALGILQLVGQRACYAALAAALAFGLLTIRRNRDYQSDRAIWRSSVNNFPASARAHNNYGEAFSRERRFPEAVAQYREAVRLLPNYRDALCNLGAALHRIGKQEEGMEILTTLVRRFPNVHEILSAYGGACYREGRVDEAKRYFERAIALGPLNAEASNNLSVLLNNEGKPREAIRLLETALSVRPSYTDAMYNYAISLTQLSDIDGAIRMLRRTLEIDPGYPEANNNLGALLVQKGQREEAIRFFQRAILEKPDYPDALNNLGVMLTESGKASEAIKLFERALLLQPQLASARSNLEYAQQVLNEPQAQPKP